MLIPKGVTFSLMPDAGDSHLLVIESPAPLTLTEHQQVGRHMPVDPTILTVPEPCDYGFPAREEYELRVKHGGAHSSIFYRNNPLVSVGWKGDLFPYKLNIRDIIPISSDRIHLAPSAWATFEANGFMVVTFVPQMAVSDLNAEELPSYHRNVDYDESVFVHAGAAGARKPGTLSHVPQGILHGADEAARAAFQAQRKPGMRRTLTGVSVDTERPLIAVGGMRAADDVERCVATNCHCEDRCQQLSLRVDHRPAADPPWMKPPRLSDRRRLPLPLREGVGGRGRGSVPRDPSPRPPPSRGGGGCLCEARSASQ